MHLSEFIRSNSGEIIAEWEAFARTLRPASGMNALQLKDHIEEILSFISDDLDTAQTAQQQFDKSRGLSDEKAGPDTAAESHGLLRYDDGYDIVEMISEYRALRASIIKLWTRNNRALTDDDVLDLTRFNEAIDQALAESVVMFSRKVEQSKDLLLSILGHDIRSPLATIHMSAQMLMQMSEPTARQHALLTQIGNSTDRVRSIVSDLLDLAEAQLGRGIPLIRGPMSLSDLCVEIVDEIRIQHPARPFTTEIEDGVRGTWDRVRLGQVVSNLLSNAVQYGQEGTCITIALKATADAAMISVHNEGDPIPAMHLESIFKSFTRAPGNTGAKAGSSQNLGLGLFISREIINAHGGSIKAQSETNGTTFSVILPVD